MLWQNEPTVVIGKNQNAYAEVDTELLAKKGIHLARRITGGGAVYHDLGNVNYTFISAAAQEGIDFAGFTAPILHALKALGITATLSGRNDLLLEGKKFSGNAQHTANGKTLHHGTLLFDSDLEVLGRVLRPDEEKLRSKAVKSARGRVTNLAPFLKDAPTVDKFIQTIADFVQRTYRCMPSAPPQHAEIDALCARNASDEWIFPARSLLADYTVIKKERYPFGSVCVHLFMCNDCIKNATVTGDFFGNAPISELEDLLCGLRLSALEQHLSGFSIAPYIHGMTTEQWITLLKK